MTEEFDRYVDDPLWSVLVETVHSMIMYPHHKAYVSKRMMSERPGITPRELAADLGIPYGEALVILYELKIEKPLRQP